MIIRGATKKNSVMSFCEHEKCRICHLTAMRCTRMRASLTVQELHEWWSL